LSLFLFGMPFLVKNLSFVVKDPDDIIHAHSMYQLKRSQRYCMLWTDSSVTSSSDVTRRRLLLVARRIYVLFVVIHIIQSLLVWFVRAGSI